LNVLFFTDVHGKEEALAWVARKGRGFDAIIVGGDLARGASPGSQSFVGKFLEAALSSTAPVYYVPGNWDSMATPVPDGVVPLHGAKVKLGGYTVGGLGGSNPTPFNTPFELGDPEAKALLDGVGRVDVLVSHSPPARTKCDRASVGHIGSVPVREYVERERPMLVLSGHVHESRAVDNVGGVTVVNPGPMLDGNYAEVRLDGVVSVELKAETLGG
jgi:uncharacterized protein